MLCCAAASLSSGPAAWPVAVAGEPDTATIATATPTPVSAAAGRFHRECRMSPPPRTPCLPAVTGSGQAPPPVEPGRDGDRGLGDVGAGGLQPLHLSDRE